MPYNSCNDDENSENSIIDPDERHENNDIKNDIFSSLQLKRGMIDNA